MKKLIVNLIGLSFILGSMSVTTLNTYACPKNFSETQTSKTKKNNREKSPKIDSYKKLTKKNLKQENSLNSCNTYKRITEWINNKPNNIAYPYPFS